MRVVAENYEQTTHTYTHTHTHTRDNYSNPRCAHARRGLTTVSWKLTQDVHALAVY